MNRPGAGSANQILIKASRACEQEKIYIFDWVFRELFGIDYEIEWATQSGRIEISHSENSGKVVFRDEFFSNADKNWLSVDSLPSSVKSMKLAHLPDDETLSVFDFGSETPLPIDGESSDTHFVNFDLFGSLFFLISCYEEGTVDAKDARDRFPSEASILGKSELLEEPIGNQYIETLWSYLKLNWPFLERKKREFRVLASHDIDDPSAYWKSLTRLFRGCVGPFLRGTPKQAIQVIGGRLKHIGFTRKRNWTDDPNETMDWIMDQSENHNLKSAFYYIPEKTHHLDPGMPIGHPQVSSQWKRIARRGHEIGVHPGYDTYLWPQRIKSAVVAVQNQLEKLRINQGILGGRQHFLRWKSPQTAIALDQAGMDYDSTLAFADRSGFRCGVCYEFPMYDLIGRRKLKIRQRPLVVMDCTVIDERYMGLGHTEQAYDFMIRLKNSCRKYDGDFTILWHNQRFRDERERSLYRDVLAN